MKAYVDASVVLRIILRAPKPLDEWPSIEEHISSALLRVECLRTLERLGIEDNIADDEIARRSNEVRIVIESVRMLNITPAVLARAAEPFGTLLKSLDAIHLATAIEWRSQGHADFAFATHDRQLSRAAEAAGFPLLGVA